MTLSLDLAIIACILAAAALVIAVRAHGTAEWAARAARGSRHQMTPRRIAEQPELPEEEPPLEGAPLRASDAAQPPARPEGWVGPWPRPEEYPETQELPRLPRPGQM